LFARYRLSRPLFQQGRSGQARLEITNTITYFDPGADPRHILLRAAKTLLELIDVHPTSETLIV
jgi:hypothetical protein